MERWALLVHPEMSPVINTPSGKGCAPHQRGIRKYLPFVFMLLALGGQGAWKWYFTSDKSFSWTQPSLVMSPKVTTWLLFGSVSLLRTREASLRDGPVLAAHRGAASPPKGFRESEVGPTCLSSSVRTQGTAGLPLPSKSLSALAV